MKNTKEKILNTYILAAVILLFVGTCFCHEMQNVFAADIYMSETSLTLTKGNSKKLKVGNITKPNAKIKWSTTNKYAATVTKKGRVKAVNYGRATIKAKWRKQIVTCVVNIPDTSRSVTLNSQEVALEEGTTFQLVAQSVKKVKYQSANDAIATVDSNGVITAVNPGIVKITAKSSRGENTCMVTVNSTDTESETEAWLFDKNVVAVRRVTKNNNFVYGNISWAKNKSISFGIDNLDEETVKKCVWTSENPSVLSKPIKDINSKIKVTANTLAPGTTKITATVTDKNGKVTTYSNCVYVSEPSINTKSLILLGGAAGSNRQQFISFSGLSPYSEIKWSNSNYFSATISEYKTKAAVWGVQPGEGVITATVDGKTYNVSYRVYCPVFVQPIAVLAADRTTKIVVQGIEGLPINYSSRNKRIATVSTDGVVTGKKAGVTYIDISFGNMKFSYRIEVAAKGIKRIVKRAKFIVNNWKYSQARRMQKGFYDCSSLVWKGYRKYNKYHRKLGSGKYALPAGELFDYLYANNKIVYYGYTGIDNLKPGDLIFYGDYENAVIYSTPGRTLDIYHVSMYAGAGEIVEKDGRILTEEGAKYIVGIGRVVK